MNLLHHAQDVRAVARGHFLVAVILRRALAHLEAACPGNANGVAQQRQNAGCASSVAQAVQELRLPVRTLLQLLVALRFG